METAIGIVILGCILIIAHFTQVAAQQLRSLNSKMDEFMRAAKDK